MQKVPIEDRRFFKRISYRNIRNYLTFSISFSFQTKQALAIIPTSILELEDIIKPDAHETCAVCIEQFKVGESVRSLPCQHQFHKSCIDLWLMEKPTCPMCKLDILKRYGLEKTSSGDEMVWIVLLFARISKLFSSVHYFFCNLTFVDKLDLFSREKVFFALKDRWKKIPKRRNL